MKPSFSAHWLVALACGLLALSPPARAQAPAEWSRWYFGQQAGLRFSTTTPALPTVLADNQLEADGAAATLCDSVGQLLLYTNGVRVLNGRHQVLVGGSTLGGDSTSSQGSVLLPQPGQRGRYYLFTLGSWLGWMPYRGLRVVEIDLRAAGGRGQVLRTSQPVVPDTLLQRLGSPRFMEVQALVRHPSGRYYWLLTHLLNTNVFLSTLVDGTGFPRRATVVSAVGGLRNNNVNVDSPGMLAASPDGRRLALTSLVAGAELFDFDPATGQVSNPVYVGGGVYSAGVAFSPSGSLLYVSRQGPAAGTNCTTGNAVTEVRQYDLRLATPAAVVASGQVVYSFCGGQIWGLQRGFDGRIYVAKTPAYTGSRPTMLDYIAAPDMRGTGCQYVAAGLNLGAGRSVERQFPVVPSGVPLPRLLGVQGLLPAASGAAACAGQLLALRLAGATLGAPGDTLDWSFGDGRSLRTTAPQATHTYAQPGSYQLVVRLRNRLLGPPEQVVVAVQVTSAPVVNLGPDVRLCAGSVAQLSVGSLPAGATVRWHDGLTAPTRPASTAGLYWAEVTSAAGCTARDSVQVSLLPGDATPLALTASGALCPGRPVALGPGQGQPVGSQYLWQDGSTGYALVTSTPGTYTLRITSPGGCTRLASLVLAYAPDCVGQLPTVITPNQDGQNDTFVLAGLVATDWSLALYNRWGRELLRQVSYDNSWSAQGQAAGIYYYLLTNRATGRRVQGWVEVVK